LVRFWDINIVHKKSNFPFNHSQRPISASSNDLYETYSQWTTFISQNILIKLITKPHFSCKLKIIHSFLLFPIPNILNKGQKIEKILYLRWKKLLYTVINQGRASREIERFYFQKVLLEWLNIPILLDYF
jgi:hypothetical protein